MSGPKHIRDNLALEWIVIVAVLLVFAVYSYLALEAWTLSRPGGSGTGTRSRRARNLANMQVTPVEPLRLPSARALMTGPLTRAGVSAARVPRARAAGPEIWGRL